ncbi:MAG TPA: rod shape-determining protein MreC [Candidatus Saccharimonadia bacterium]|nr:rod shape-determining protein MreC [Candidatus Saccharimonadia bacterium]
MTLTPKLSSNDRAPLFAEGAAGTLRLAIYLMLAALAMVADYRGHYVEQVRGFAGSLAGPVYWLAAAPVRLVRAGYGAANDRGALRKENQGLRERLMLSEARLSRLAAVQDENARLRTLLDARTRLGLKAQLGELIDVDLDPFRHRLLIDLGANDGLEPGQAVMDAHGVLGQVLDVGRDRSVLVLITDASHALPVRVVRTGLRTIAYGSGDTATLRLPHIPFRADVRPGDELVTSGIGGHFPAGLPVGVVREVTPDDVATFALALATPSAGLARSGEVLVLHDERERLPKRGAAQPELEGPPESMPVAAPEARADAGNLAGGSPR